jgi:hypothetical protein
MVSSTDVAPDDTVSVLDTRRNAYIAFTDILEWAEPGTHVEAGKPTLGSLLAKCVEACRITARPSTRDIYGEFQLGLSDTLEAPSAAFTDTWALSPFDHIGENIRLRFENALLQRGLAEIEQRLARIEAALPEVKVVVLREISRSEAKKEIKEFFAQGDALDYEDIIDKLSLDLELVVDICNELIEEGEIAPDAGVHATG